MPACRAPRRRAFRSSGRTRSRRTGRRPFPESCSPFLTPCCFIAAHISRSVIPHQAGHHRGSVVAIHAARQVRRQRAALALQAVTLNALLALEQLLAAPRVAGDRCWPPAHSRPTSAPTAITRSMNIAGLLFAHSEPGHERVRPERLHTGRSVRRSRTIATRCSIVRSCGWARDRRPSGW